MTFRISRIHKLLLLALVGLTSCIKGELPNIDVDVIAVTSLEGNLSNVVIHPGGEIEAYAVPGTDLSNLKLEFELSPGATIAPEPATVTDYTSPRTFRVTSEDGQWTLDYRLSVRITSIPTRYEFEHWLQPDKMRYLIPYELKEATRMMVWSCGNQAYNFLTDKFDDYTVFPTQPTEESYSGKYAAKLITRLTGQVDKPIAAGNLFIGQFDGSKYDPKESTMFGLPFMSKPLRLKGMYKYRSGGLTNKSGKEDCCRIQAILYRTDTGESHLNGYTSKNSENIIARAELTEEVNATPSEGYVPFELDFVYRADFDTNLMERGHYNLTIIFSSSRNGDEYDGAPGSTLLIDDVEIICQ